MDGLSGAASVAGVVSLSVQLAESIHKICKFLSALKHAPEEIQDIIDDLEVLGCVLADIQRSEELFDPQNATAKALQRCRRQVQALDNMILQWSKDIVSENKRRRGQTAFVSVLKTDKVKEWRAKISEAKETLSLALQASSSLSSRFQQAHILAIVEGMSRIEHQTAHISRPVSHAHPSLTNVPGYAQQSLSSLGPDSVPVHAISAAPLMYPLEPISPSSLVCQSTSRRKLPYEIGFWGESQRFGLEGWTKSLLGTLTYKHGSRESEKHLSKEKNEALRIVFYPPWWLQTLGINTLLHAQIDRSSRSGWKISLQMPHLMTLEVADRVEEAIAGADLQTLRGMLITGEVTIGSVNTSGRTLLHMAANFGQRDICAFLLDIGVDRNARDDYDSPAFRMIAHSPVISKRSQLATMQAFVAAGEDFMNVDSAIIWFLDFRNLQDHPGGPEDIEEPPSCWLLRQAASVMPFYDVMYRERVWYKSASSTRSSDPYETEFMRILFRQEMLISSKRRALADRIQLRLSEELATLWLCEIGGTVNFLDSYPPLLPGAPRFTLSTAAMKSPRGFCGLRDFLLLVNVSIGDFVRGEIPFLNQVVEDGSEPWTEEQLLNLFTWECNYLVLNHRDSIGMEQCRRCGSLDIDWSDGEGNALWNMGVEKIKAGKSPEGPFEGEEKELADKWRGFYERYHSEGICPDCQEKEENSDLELEPSPMLLDI